MMVFGDKGNMSAKGTVMSEQQNMQTNYGRPSEDFTSFTAMFNGGDTMEPITNRGGKPDYSDSYYANKTKCVKNAESWLMAGDKGTTGWGK